MMMMMMMMMMNIEIYLCCVCCSVWYIDKVLGLPVRYIHARMRPGLSVRPSLAVGSVSESRC